MASSSTVGDFVTLQRGTTYKGTLVGKPGPALLGLGSIRPGGGFRDGDFKTYGGDCPGKLMLYPGDLFVSLKGATKDGEMIGSVARVPPSVPCGRLTQDTVKLEFRDSCGSAASFLYWILRTPQYRDYCAGRATGSAVVALSREDFLSFPVPPITSDRAGIVELLEALEGKVEVNRQANEALEAMARAIFKSWFVEFDPVRVCAGGCKPLGMDAETAALFPRNISAGIPLGWREVAVREISFVNQKVLSKANSPRRIQYLEISRVNRGEAEIPVSFETSEAPSRARRVLSHGDSVLSTVRPDRMAYFLCLDPPPNLVGSTGFAVFTPRNVPWSYLHCVLSQADLFAWMGSQADGGAYPAISPDRIGDWTTVMPSEERIMVAFDELVAPLFTLAERNRRESRTLSALRDFLLPKLISGEIRLKDAEKELAAI